MSTIDKERVSERVKEVIEISEQLEARWLECSFETLSNDISELKEMAKESTNESFIYLGWADIAGLIFNKRVEEITELPQND